MSFSLHNVCQQIFLSANCRHSTHSTCFCENHESTRNVSNRRHEFRAATNTAFTSLIFRQNGGESCFLFKFHLDSFRCRTAVFIMPPPRGHYAVIGVRRPSVCPSVCLSVCLSVRLSDVAYIGSNSKTKRPRKTKLCTGVPQVTCDSHTDFKVKRSKVKVTGRGHIVAAT